jgi:non-heme chloroperoxidase
MLDPVNAGNGRPSYVTFVNEPGANGIAETLPTTSGKSLAVLPKDKALSATVGIHRASLPPTIKVSIEEEASAADESPILEPNGARIKRMMVKCLACPIWVAVMSLAAVSIDCLAIGQQTAQQTSANTHATTLTIRVEQASTWHDPSPHRIQFVFVEKDVKIEVLDWGGTGRSLVLLAGLGNTAHVYDDIAPKRAEKYHVFGITRRGFSASSSPSSGYTADRLGDDVIDIISALKIVHPVLVGHSIAGEELSSVGSRYPTRIAGLVYLDAGYLYAYQNPTARDLAPELEALQKRVEELMPSAPPTDADLTNFSTFRAWRTRSQGVELPEAELRQILETTPDGHITHPHTQPATSQAIRAGAQKFTDIRVPILAIYAIPHNFGVAFGKLTDRERSEIETDETTTLGAIAQAFQSGLPSAHVVRLHANHYVFLSNEHDVLLEISSFTGTLPK